jgi:hypothetical protein
MKLPLSLTVHESLAATYSYWTFHLSLSQQILREIPEQRRRKEAQLKEEKKTREKKERKKNLSGQRREKVDHLK